MMSAHIINGREIAEQIRNELRQEVNVLATKGIVPGLAVVIVGENPASQIYVKMKAKAAAELGIYSETLQVPADVEESKLLQQIDDLNRKNDIHAILVQLPLPKHINEQRIIQAILPEKDVDGFHPVNRGKLVIGEETFVPCTPLGIQELLLRSHLETSGKHVTIVGRSKIVGLPLVSIFLQKKDGANSTVTVCHTGTPDISYFTKQADILIAAIGKPEIITGDMVKEDVVVIDVGINRIKDTTHAKGYRIVGDVDYASVSRKAKAITPVPGGVGPMTIAMLMQNTVKAATKQMRL